MRFSKKVVDLVSGLAVPEAERLSFAQAAVSDERDAKDVEEHIDQYQQRLIPIVRQLRTFSGKNFHIEFERHYKFGRSKSGGRISIDFACLKKAEGELALIMAHEWGHQSMGHLRNEYWSHALGVSVEEAERQADYYAGIFLGVYNYDLTEVIKNKLSTKEMDKSHDGWFERACVIMQGFCHGQELRTGNQHPSLWPGFELPPEEKKYIQETQESNSRKLAK